MSTATSWARPDGTARRAPGWALNPTNPSDPWRALWAMMVGFFMILVDSTIVAVANPTIMGELGTGYDTVIWVTSAYLLAYAVPLLVAGRLGDRFGAKNLYVIGLVVFTAASLWCGLSGSIGVLIAARVVQGVGAGLLTPQTLSMITRIFPAERRGVAMSVWGATAGVATLVGPLAGGALVGFGWEWIFFVNVPIGIVGVALAIWLVPALPTQNHRFDPVAVGLSAAAMFLVVFALQEGQSAGWRPWIWAVLVAGIGFGAAFVYWQSVNTREPLIPLEIFSDRYFRLSSVGVAVIGFSTTAMVLPLMFYAQIVCGLSPTRSALLMAPMAVTSGVLAPIAGKVVDRSHPGPVIGFGFSMLAIALTWLSIEMTPTTPIWRLVLPLVAMGGGNAFIWAPLGATATRNLSPHLAGASSGVYNATRQVGAVLGSAGMAAFLTSRIAGQMPPGAGRHSPGAGGMALQVPRFLREPFAAAMSQSMLLPAFVALFGVGAALCLVGIGSSVVPRRRGAGSRDRPQRRPALVDNDVYDFVDDEEDDDAYVEFTLLREPDARRAAEARVRPVRPRSDDDTEPLSARVDRYDRTPAQALRSNGFHSDEGQRTGPLTQLSSPAGDPFATDAIERRFFDDVDEISFQDLWSGKPARHQSSEGEPPRNRHYRADADDSGGSGRHSFPD